MCVESTSAVGFSLSLSLSLSLFLNFTLDVGGRSFFVYFPFFVGRLEAEKACVAERTDAAITMKRQVRTLGAGIPSSESSRP